MLSETHAPWSDLPSREIIKRMRAATTAAGAQRCLPDAATRPAEHATKWG